ncbi:MAG TPA: hypothetical protein VK879_04800 [Candidatus Sulfomarinibacteraceae bacterium]|nr:hypothetical protein [Candidatus Sulfomarinibacteraceae bacterium]
MFEGNRRWDGGPAAALVLFFLLPTTLFLGVWYAEYFSPVLRTPLIIILGAAVLLIPPVLVWWQATRERRRRFLWTTLVLAGTVLSIWLPANTLLQDGPLPPGAHTVWPEAYAEATAIVLIAAIPLLMGALPVVLYALAVGQVRPVAGGTGSFAAAAIYVAGALIWCGSLLLALLNPFAPPLIDQQPVTSLTLEAELPPEPAPDALPMTWARLLWRLRDSTPPGAVPTADEGNRMMLGLPRRANTEVNMQLVRNRGVVQIVDFGMTRVQPGTELLPLERLSEGVEAPYRVVVTGNALQWQEHWSGMHIGNVSLTSSPSDRPVLRLAFDEAGSEAIREFTRNGGDNYMGVVLDGLVVLSTPVIEPMVGDEFVIRGLNPGTAQLLASVLRYGPLPATVNIDQIESPSPGEQVTE